MSLILESELKNKLRGGDIVKPFAQFLTTVVSKSLLIFAVFGTVSLFFYWKKYISKGKFDIFEILMLLFDFCILTFKCCNTILNT